MRPFKMFFGLAIGIILFFFVAKIVFFAFIAAAIMSIIFAIFRRLRDFITYDRNGDYYIKGHNYQPAFNYNQDRETEPLFYENAPYRRSKINNIQFIEAV